MEKKYKIQKNPFVVPTTDGKLIQEHWGNSTGNAQISIAYMIAPPHWSEPHQTPEFDEFTIIMRGKKQFEIDGGISSFRSWTTHFNPKRGKNSLQQPFRR